MLGDPLLNAVEKYILDKSIPIEKIEELIFSSDIKHPEMYLQMDTLMSYFYYGHEKLPLSPYALEHLLLYSDLNHITLDGKNALLILLDTPDENYSCVPYLVEKSNIFTQELLKPYSLLNEGVTTNALTKIFNLYIKDNSYDLPIETWERLFMAPMLESYTGVAQERLQELKKEVKEYTDYGKFKNHLEVSLALKIPVKKVKI